LSANVGTLHCILAYRSDTIVWALLIKFGARLF
jgi:hypothetical protein